MEWGDACGGPVQTVVAPERVRATHAPARLERSNASCLRALNETESERKKRQKRARKNGGESAENRRRVRRGGRSSLALARPWSVALVSACVQQLRAGSREAHGRRARAFCECVFWCCFIAFSYRAPRFGRRVFGKSSRLASLSGRLATHFEN